MDQRLISSKKILLIFSTIIATTAMIFLAIYLLFISGESITSKNVALDKNGTQIIQIAAKYGFKPDITYISANKPAILKIDTNGTFGCSSTVSIPKLLINETLPSTGIKDFDIPAQQPGSEINATCSSGLYSFKIVVS